MVSLPVFADCLPLIDGKTVTGQFNRGATHCFTVDLTKQRYVDLNTQGVQNLRLVNPKGNTIRPLLRDIPSDSLQTMRFLVPETAQYQLILQGEAEQKWQLTLATQPYIPLAIQGEPNLISPRLRTVANALTDNNIAQFWQQIRLQGAPLVEPYDNDKKLVTFVWQGAMANVYLLGSPEGNHDPLIRLGDSDIWYRSYIVPNDTLMQYKLAPDVPQIAGATGFEQRRAILTTAQADPLNRQGSPNQTDSPFDHFSLLSLNHQRECQLPEILNRTLQGKTALFRFNSQILGNEREIALYQPQQKMVIPRMMVIFDGQTYRRQYGIDRFFDKQIAEGKLPPMMLLFVDSLDSDRRSKELPPNPDFYRFLADELFVWLEKEQGIQIVGEETIVAGSSYGGLAAAWVAFQRPERFGKVLSMSGSYWWAPENEEPEWLIRQFAQAEKKPLQFFLEAGLFESRGQDGGILQNNRHLKQVLTQKGYNVTSLEMASGHDYISWCETLYLGAKALTQPQ